MRQEEFQWTKTWWSHPDITDLPRILLVGDSIVCGYGPSVRKKLDGKVNVDYFATSRFVASPFFQAEFGMYLSSMKYDCIHFNNGIHGWVFPLSEYKEGYEKALLQVLAVCSNVILVPSTPVTRRGFPDEPDELNQVMLERNQFVLEMAEKYHLPVDDLYALMEGHPEYRTPDGFHYNEDGIERQAVQVTDCVLSHLSR